MKRKGKPAVDPKLADESAFSGFGLIAPNKNVDGSQKGAEYPGFYLYTLPKFRSVPSKQVKAPISFDFVTESSQRPLVGYLFPSGFSGEIVPALRVEIDGTWNKNPFYLAKGSMTISFGHLRISAITLWGERFSLNKIWVFQLWSRIEDTFKNWISENYLNGIASSACEYHPIMTLDRILTRTAIRYIAIVSLWNYWKKHSIKDESKCDDLKTLGITKKVAGGKKGGQKIGGKITKGAFSTIARRAGVPK